MGTLRFSDWTSGAYLKANNKTTKLSKKTMSLPVGYYVFEIIKPGYKSKSINVSIEADKTSTVDARLEQKTTGSAMVRSLFLPGLGQAYQKKNGRTWLYPIALIGSGAAAYFYTNQYNTAVSDYNDIRARYSAAVRANDINRLRDDMHSTYDDIESAENLRNIFFITTGAIWLWNVLDTVILPPQWEKNIKLSAGADDNHLRASVSINF